ncbi:hypothetical protein JD292_05775 [Leucobacter sp. CSA2]|uniref:Uncharacterized protein n=1 Tax=Leucobacter edaphi TaxID=2796472 RepID=A0A934UY24_9MICO|nr:hypothetical protein [Leucobacter edaphi]MBK0421577.1 hypothetical protein [Leucobacter edaphi]
MTQNELITVVALAAFAMLLLSVWQFDRRRRRQESQGAGGSGGSAAAGIFGSCDEVFHPEGARASEIREIQRELPAEAAVPGDPIRPDRPLTITLPPPTE